VRGRGHLSVAINSLGLKFENSSTLVFVARVPIPARTSSSNIYVHYLLILILRERDSDSGHFTQLVSDDVYPTK
jgi:hypothetical protein